MREAFYALDGFRAVEEDEFEPMFESVKPALDGKKIALFGSFGWGDGEWMRNWEADCAAAGAVLVADPVICQTIQRFSLSPSVKPWRCPEGLILLSVPSRQSAIRCRDFMVLGGYVFFFSEER